MNNACIVAALSLLAATSAATAGDLDGRRGGDLAPYFGVSGGLLRYDDGGVSGLSPGVILARIGLPITPYVGFEGRLGTGVASAEHYGNSVRIGTIGGGYIKGSWPVAPTFSVYGVAGVGTVTLNRNFGDGDTTKTGFSFGVGGDVKLTRRLVLNFEWTRYPNGTNFGYSFNSNLATIGINWRF
jgi:opacity protein-like surface antigen